MDARKRDEILTFFWLGVSALTFGALVTYTPNDIPFEVSVPNEPAKNFVGIAGAYFAWAVTTLFGKAAFFMVPLFFFWALAKWFGGKPQKLWLKIFSSVMLLVSACGFFAILAGDSPSGRFGWGGFTGFFASAFLSAVFGSAGLFVALLLFILSVLLSTELLILEIASGLFSKVAKHAGDKWGLPDAEAGAPAKKGIKPALAKMAKAVQAKEKAVVQEAKGKAVKPEPAKAVEPPKKAPVYTEPIPAKPQIKVSQPPKDIPIIKKSPPAEGGSASGGKPVPQPVSIESDAPLGAYELPTLDLLETARGVDAGKAQTDLEESSRVLEDTLRDFGIDAKVVEVEQGPTITRYELQPAAGVKVQKITALENDIALAMRAASVRIIAPIPGKPRVGIEVPNSAAAIVSLKEVLASPEYQNETSRVTIAMGKDTAGLPLVCDLAAMPHLLIAGATNTGKSVCINSIIMSLLFRSTPEELKLLIVDPKMVELHFYNDLPHLICPVVTDKGKVPSALGWLVAEMDRRYKVLSQIGAKNIVGFNEKVEKKQVDGKTLAQNAVDTDNAEPVVLRKMPYIVLVVDELADLMLVAANEIETMITRLAQLARAVGIHMILATQRPSVDVITGVIKANFPARIAFQVASKVDSRTILDENGADKLLGRGDMLLMDPRKSKLIRAQGALVRDSEIEKVTSFIKNQKKASFDRDIFKAEGGKKQAFGEFQRDEVYEEAKRVVLQTGQASVSMIQRRLGVGYTRAARLVDMMEEDGVVGPYRGAKPREILVDGPWNQKGDAVPQES